MSEFTTRSDIQYDKDCHMGIDDISIDSRDNPQLLKVTLKQSKIDLIMWVLTSTLGLQEQSYVQLKVFSLTSLCVATSRGPS